MNNFSILDLFQFREIYTTLTTWISYLGCALAVYCLFLGSADSAWLIASVAGIFCLVMGATVGLHRYFSHRTFQCSKFWEIVLAYWATLGIYGSTVQWSSLHANHHKHSDTARDPIISHWSYLFWQRNRNQDQDLKTLVKLWKNPINRFFHNFYVPVVVISVLILYLISPWALLFGYIVPLAWYHFVTSLHTFLSHKTGEPRDLSYLEFILFAGGEWAHQAHHRNIKNSRIGKFDLGYYFIKLIEK